MNATIDFNNRQTMEFSAFTADITVPWLTNFRQTQLDQFKLAKQPNRKNEHWKYNDLYFIQSNAYRLTRDTADVGIENLLAKGSNIKLEQSIELVFIDGALVTPLDDLKNLEGVSFTLFSNASASQQTVILAQKEFSHKNLFMNLNNAICENGLLIEVAKNVSVKPSMHLRYLSSSQEHEFLSSNKVCVSLASSSQLTLVEEFSSNQQLNRHLALQQTAIECGANSQLNHYRLNLNAESANQISQTLCRLNQDSVYNAFLFGLGSQLNRTDLDVLHLGQNASANINGVYLPKHSQCIDYHTNIEHRVAHCQSRENFRGIIADKASATFNGKIHIFQDAQKSDAQLNNKNLLLSNQAEINSKPELEIYADDVVCAHGATVAQLDNKALYYMQSRGINRQQAKKILSVAFVQALINDISLLPVKTALTELLNQHMSNLNE